MFLSDGFAHVNLFLGYAVCGRSRGLGACTDISSGPIAVAMVLRHGAGLPQKIIQSHQSRP